MIANIYPGHGPLGSSRIAYAQTPAAVPVPDVAERIDWTNAIGFVLTCMAVNGLHVVLTFMGVGA